MADPALADLATIDADLACTWQLLRDADTVDRMIACRARLDVLLDRRLTHRRSAPSTT